VKEVSKTTDHVDILFANAGATWGEKFDTHPDSAFAKVMDLNVKSVFNTIRLYVQDPLPSCSCGERNGSNRLINTPVGLLPFSRKRLLSKTPLEY